MENEKYILCDKITVAYERTDIFSDITFDICKGDYISVVGENGTGKSTIIKGLLGLVPLKSGKIVFMNDCSRKDIGYLSQQNSRKKDFPASVKEVVLSGSISRNKFTVFYGAEIKKRAKRIMEKLGIIELEKKKFGDLSGGQQQRVCLARALMSTEKILVMDEPVTGLDPVATAQFYEIMSKLNKEDNMTIVMVSHDMENALKYSNKILQMSEDTYFFGTKEEYEKSEVRISTKNIN